ncbi:MAG: hypothetical protein ACP59X_16315 [Solidesulfovibrio sp. DCME]|uniref:hypothetical protein n=1 Tax=Solidesulfovibrio sp. DCME TaxID=3447380 RepID=UPI003D0E8199
MIKKSIVGIEGVLALLLAAFLLGQLNLTPGAARRIDRSHPLWFMQPFRPQAAPPADSGQPAQATSGASTQPAQATSTAPGDEASLAQANRRSILAPVTSLNAVVTDLEAKDLPGPGGVLVPGQLVQSPTQAPARKRTTRPARKPPAPGPLRLTDLTVRPTTDGATIRVATSAPVSRIALFTFTTPPRLTLELDGDFADYTQPIIVPPNQVFQTLTTETTPGKLRITGSLLTPKAYVVPVTTSGQDSFTVGMTLNPDGQPNLDAMH